MPPANSPSETPTSPNSTSTPYLQQLEAILDPVLSPVPNLAATLSHTPIPIDDDANDDNVNFLRHRIPQPPEVPSSRFRRRRTTQPDDDFELIHGDEPPNLRTLAVEGRIPIIRRRREEANNVPDYGASISNYRSLYGWAPGSEEEQIQQGNEFLSGFDDHSWYSRSSEQYNDPVELGVRQSRQEESAQNLSSLTPYHFARSTNTTRAVDSIPPSESLLHSVRRGQRFSRSRPLQNYILDRERTGQETEERERTTPVLTQRPYRYLPNAARDPYRNLTHGDLRARVNAHRQIYSENPPSARLKEAIKYLERIRFSHSPEENFSSAVESGCIQPSDAPRKLDFILDTISIRPPTECSWLRPGSVFSGSQRAAHALGSQMLAHRLSDSNQASDPVIVNGSESGRISVSTTSGRRYWAANSGHPAGSSGKEENWPVRVTIHDVNFSNMTLAGTMEAYNIPDKTNLNKDAHIITFLEGEIIDFNTYTLETKSFRADVEIDSTYWRELQPFKGMTDEEMAKKLVTRKWVTEELVKGWILMRWKERCFITPSDARQGLTISGFYYISLRRETGEIEGLYYDPGSSPYQQLTLKPHFEKMVFPAYSFR